MPKPPKPDPVEVEGIVAYTTFEERHYRRENFARVVFMIHRDAGLRADSIFVPKIPAEWTPSEQKVFREWLRRELPLRLKPGGRIQYENMEDQCRVLMGQ